MWKTVLAGAAALSISGASLAFAQQTPPADPPRWRITAEDAAALTDARIAALRTGLKLSADQEKHWPALEAAIREMAKLRFDGLIMRQDAMAAHRGARGNDNAPPRPDIVERMRRGADHLATRGAALKKLADAADPLYKSLDDGQKRRFTMMMRMGQQGFGHDGPPWRRRG